jgi:exopolysaccharide biosynthesis polyprenyl glycosylphosphotransferase
VLTRARIGGTDRFTADPRSQTPRQTVEVGGADALHRLEDGLSRALGAAAGPLAGGLLAARFAPPGDRAHTGAFAAVVFFCGVLALRGERPWASVAPGTGMSVLAVAGATLGVALLAAAVVTGAVAALSRAQLAWTWSGATAAAIAPLAATRLLRHRRPPIRLAVVGPGSAATVLQWDIHADDDARYEVVGRIAEAGAEPPEPGALPPTLGSLEEIERVIRAHRLQMLLIAAPAARRGTFDRLLDARLPHQVRAGALDDFYERVFGHVPVHRIDGSWFESMLGFDRGTDRRIAKRALDVALALALGLALAPVLAVLALLIRRDGGPALYRQVRVGAGGAPFVMYKLRTMRLQPAPTAACWAVPDDPRTTRVGRLVRRSHLDEAPQFLNVLRGDMSFVGPRPEQPEIVAQLERRLPFYSRRHLIKPGITGWAQVRCGYAGTDEGAYWKLCHDLYYVRHHSLLFDLAILLATFGSLNDDGRGHTRLHVAHLEPPQAEPPRALATDT